jgi:hypothetical protein
MQGTGIRRCVLHVGRLDLPQRMLATVAAQGKVRAPGGRQVTVDWLESAWRVAYATPMMAEHIATIEVSSFVCDANTQLQA